MELTERAKKKAYFSDLDGGHIVDFQFAPEELNLTEGGRFADRVTVGHYFTDYVWLSGKPNKLKLTMWIDRTQESMITGDLDVNPFEDVLRFPRRSRPRFTNFDVVNLVRGIASGGTSSGFASTFKKKNTAGANQIDPTVHSATPDFNQSGYNESVGVYRDVEKLMYYVRPEGFELGTATFQNDGSVKISDFKQARFTPPPMCRFFYGSMWMEGYIEEVKYNLTVMNKQLVPRRLEAEISFIRTNWGYLNEIASDVSAEDFYEVSSSPRYF